MATGPGNMSFKRPTLGFFLEGKLAQLEFEIKIAFANVLFLVLFNILTAVKGAI